MEQRSLQSKQRHELSPKKTVFYFSAVEILTWVTITGWGFLVPFLRSDAIGLTSTQVGFTIALNGLMGFMAPPFWGQLADRLGSARKVFMIMLIGSAAFWLFIPFAALPPISSLILMSIVLQISMMFIRPLISILDSWIMNVVNVRADIEYSVIRVWGSIGSCLSSFVMSAAVAAFGINVIFYSYAMFAVPTVLLCFFYRHEGKKAITDYKDSQKDNTPAKKQKKGVITLLKNPLYFIFIVLLFMMNIPVNNGYTYITYLFTSIGGDAASSLIGAYTGIRAAIEIPCVFFSARIIRKFEPEYAILIPALCMISEQFLYTICSTTTQILLVAPLGGIAYGLYIPCMVSYTNKLAPEGLKATAQSISGGMYSLTGILANLAGGWAVSVIGVKPYFLVCGVLVLVSISSFFVALRKGRPHGHKLIE